MSHDFGLGDGPWEPTVEQVIEHLAGQVCSLDEPYAGPGYHDDHGHTHCLFVGWAIKMLRDAKPETTGCPACNETGDGPIDSTCAICDGRGQIALGAVVRIGLAALLTQDAMLFDGDNPVWWCGCGDGVDLDDAYWREHRRCINCWADR